MQTGLSRRDALKLLGLTSIASTSLHANDENIHLSHVKAKIIVIGGGLAGVSTATRLANSLANPDITIIEPNLKSISFQSEFTLQAVGICDKEDVEFNIKDYLSEKINLLNAKAVEFNPESNKVVISSGETLSYDFLVVSSGLTLDFPRIKGLEEFDEITSTQNASSLLDKLKDSGISSVYNMNMAEEVNNQINKLISKASNNNKLKAIFSHPNTKTKCSNVSKNMMFLTNSLLKENSVRKNVQMDFYTGEDNMSKIKEYDDLILKYFKRNSFSWSYEHTLEELDISNKIAIFNKTWKENADYDTHREVYNIVQKNEKVEVPYDFLHITPPMKVSDEILYSALVDDSGFVSVDKETLQHKMYPNVFSLGDVASLPMSKTGASVRKQYKIVAQNMLDLMEGKNMSQKYDGYTACPIITDIGEMIFCEYDWNNKPISTFPLDPLEPRYVWWLMKLYLLKPMVMNGMLSGKL